jgi:hypothetical protein
MRPHRQLGDEVMRIVWVDMIGLVCRVTCRNGEGGLRSVIDLRPHDQHL